MSVGLYSGVSGLALGVSLYKNVSGLWGGATGLINGFDGGSPYSGSSLYLDFLSMQASTFDPRITFTRSSQATVVDSTGKITYAPNNLITYSEQFDNAVWAKSLCTVTANQTAAPDGTTTADLVTDNSTSGTELSQTATVSSGAVVSHSRYVKYTNCRWVRFVIGDGTNFVRGWFDVQNGTVGSTTVGGTGGSAAISMSAAGNGWYRCTLTGALSGLTSYPCLSMTADANLSIGRVNAGTYYLWGAQLEAVTYQTTPSTYIPTTSAAYYGPRFDHDPVTLAAKGLLVEEQRTNLLTYSEQFDNAVWIQIGATVSANAVSAPSGSTVADKIIEDTTTGAHRVIATGANAISVTSGATYTFSFFAKNAGRDFAYIRVNNAGGDFITGTVRLSDAVVTQTLSGAISATKYADGWVRIVGSGSPVSTAVASAEIRCANAATYANYTGDGTSGIYIWGAQLEAGSFATSYIPTVASQVTRTADVAAITGANFSSWYNQSEGTFIVGASIAQAGTDIYTWATLNGTTAQIAARRNTSNLVSGWNRIGSVNNDVVGTASWTTGTVKIAYAIKSSDQAVSVNGGAVATNTSAAFTQSADRLIIGALGTGGTQMNGHIRSIAYYPTRLANSQLQALTS